MTTRHRAREVALQVLYRYDVTLSDSKNTATTGNMTGAELAKDLQNHFEHFQIGDNLRGFSAHLIAGTLQELNKLDEIIEKSASNWKIMRMPLIDRMLLRMAAYELVFVPETPATVVINEAVELAKEFGTAETPAFVNGVLDHIRRNQKPATQA